MSREWILGSTSRSVWHLSTLRSGKYSGSYRVAVCNGKTVGGAWGPSVFKGAFPGEVEHAMCQRCKAIAEAV